MKHIKTTIAGTLIVTGLLMAGAESTDFTTQLVAGTCGIVMFALGLRWVVRIWERSEG